VKNSLTLSLSQRKDYRNIMAFLLSVDIEKSLECCCQLIQVECNVPLLHSYQHKSTKPFTNVYKVADIETQIYYSSKLCIYFSILRISNFNDYFTKFISCSMAVMLQQRQDQMPLLDTAQWCSRIRNLFSCVFNMLCIFTFCICIFVIFGWVMDG